MERHEANVSATEQPLVGASDPHHPTEEDPMTTTTDAPAEAAAPPEGSQADLAAAVARLRAERAAAEAKAPAGTLGAAVSNWRDRLTPELRAAFDAARAEARAEGYAAALAERRAADQAEAAAENARRQEEARDKAWHRCCPTKYADARVDNLLPQQDPDGRVSGWWANGGQNLVAVGPSRHGKTHLAYAIGHQARAGGSWVLGWSAIALIDAMRPGAPDNGLALHNAIECRLLIVDDLGRDRPTEWSRERWTLLFDTRLNEGRRTIITTNDDYDTLVARYGDPIIQRLQEDATIVHIEGKPLSTPSPW